VAQIVSSAVRLGVKRQISKRTFSFLWDKYTVVMSSSLKTILDVAVPRDGQQACEVITVHPDVATIMAKKASLDYFAIQRVAEHVKQACKCTTKKSDYRRQFIYDFAGWRIVFASNHSMVLEMRCPPGLAPQPSRFDAMHFSSFGSSHSPSPQLHPVMGADGLPRSLTLLRLSSIGSSCSSVMSTPCRSCAPSPQLHAAIDADGFPCDDSPSLCSVLNLRASPVRHKRSSTLPMALSEQLVDIAPSDEDGEHDEGVAGGDDGGLDLDTK